MGFLGGASGKEPAWQCRRPKSHGFDPWVRKIPGGGHSNPLQYSCLENLIEEPGGLQSIRSQRAGYDWSIWAHSAGLSMWSLGWGTIQPIIQTNKGKKHKRIILKERASLLIPLTGEKVKEEYHKQLYNYKFGVFDDIDRFLAIYKLLKLTQGEIDNINWPIF